MAPGADLIIVKAGDDSVLSTAVICGMSFIDTQAGLLGAPYVINMSFGSQLGAHDGTALDELAIDTLVGSGAGGKAVVVAAGNAGNDDIHASGTVVADAPGASTESVTFSVPAGVTLTVFDIWYEGADTFRFGWTEPGGLGLLARDDWYPVGFDFDVVDCFTVPGGTPAVDVNCVGVAHLVDPSNGDKEVFVLLFADGAATLVPGAWTLQLEGATVVAGGRFDAWSLFDPFTSDLDPSMRVGMPGTANNAITVGAYTTREFFGSERPSVP
jgi:subtilisin family serine protease